jgi:transposase
LLPVFSHAIDDIRSFRMITSQFCALGNCKLVEISRAFGIPIITVKRGVKLYREKGAAGFFAPRPTRGARVLTEEVVAKVQEKLDEGLHPSLVSDQLGLKRDTVRKAIAAGRLHRPSKKKVKKLNHPR